MHLCELECFLDNFDALALEYIRELCVFLDVSVVEFGNHSALGAAPIMKQRSDDSARLEHCIQADAVEHFQGSGMVSLGVRHMLREIRFGQGTKQDDRTTFMTK